MKGKILIASALLITTAGFAALTEPENYKFEQSFNIKAPGTYSFSVPASAASDAVWNLSGSTLSGPKGANVPFTVNIQPEKQDVDYKYYVAQEDADTAVYFSLNTEDYVESVVVGVSLKDKKKVEVYGSLDNMNWQEIQTAVITGDNPNISFDKVKAKYIKVVFKDTKAMTVPVSSGQVIFAYMPPAGSKSLTVKYKQTGNTLEAALPYDNLYIYGVKLYSAGKQPLIDGVFTPLATVEGLTETSKPAKGVFVKRGNVYSMPVEYSMNNFTSFNISLYGASLPKISKVEVTYATPEIVFNADAKGVYKLYGGTPKQEEPLPIEFKPAKNMPLNYVGSLKRNPLYKPFSDFTLGGPQECRYQKADWKYAAPIKIEEAGPQDLLLSPDVIRYASLKNVRILKDGKEVPFAAGPDHAFTTSINPHINGADGYLLNFPYTNAAVNAITFYGGDKPFEANMRLVISAPEQYKYKEYSQDFYWDYKPGFEPLTVTLPAFVMRPYQSVKVIAKTANGEVVLAKADVNYTLPSILFNAQDTTGYELVFGAKSAPTTAYEIQGFEDYLAGAVKSKAYIPVLDIADSPVDITLESESSGVFMWILYSVLVMLLIVTVGKLSKRVVRKRRAVKPAATVDAPKEKAEKPKKAKAARAPRKAKTAK